MRQRCSDDEQKEITSLSTVQSGTDADSRSGGVIRAMSGHLNEDTKQMHIVIEICV